MRKAVTLLLCVLMILAVTVDPSVAHATVSERFAAGGQQLEGEDTSVAPDAQESPADDGTEALEGEEPSEGSEAEVSEGEENPGEISAADMTPEELYDYLSALETDEEVQAVLATLTAEQLAALDAYCQSLAEQAVELPSPARNYTNAAPFKDPVYVQLPMRGFAAMQALSAEDEEDALVLDKWVSGADGSYMLTIEAYATGEVNITTGETPVPADIILVLDMSLSMDGNDMISGYTPVTYTTNNQMYTNREGMLVRVNNQYYSVTITRTSASGTYTYQYTGSGGQVIANSSGSSGSPPASWAFYKATTTTRIAALKAAANSFIDSIEAKANSGAGVDHRIAVVTYSTAAAIISGGGSAGNAFVNVHSNTGGINTLQNAINGLDTVSYTRADLGLQRAVSIFQNDYPDTSGPRNRVVVFFTDGAPCASGGGTYQEPVANDAVASAKTLKAATTASPAGCGATVYSIGIFVGADPTVSISSATNENKFMHFVSSNYPNAVSMSSPGTGSNAGYYLSASNTAGLNSIFQSISENIETGGTSVTLDEDSVINDVIAPYFQLPAGADADDIHLYTSEADEDTGAWLARQPFSGTVEISGDRTTIGVSGFDYADNYYAAIETDGVITGYQGKKLIIEIPISYIPGSCFGGTVPTNKPISGVYDDGAFVEALPIPTVDIPVTYEFTPLNQSIYVTQDTALDALFTTAAGFVADGINNAYVNIVYTVKSAGGMPLATYTIPAGSVTGTWNTSALTVSGLTANTGYTVSCTVTPVSGPVSPLTVAHSPTVYVFKPEVTFRDTEIYLGETANYADNYSSVAWKNSTAGVPLPSGAAPTLSYQFTPAAAAFAADTYVSARAFIGAAEVTSYTTFAHAACTHSGCTFDPALGQFIVHIKTCTLTIIKTGAQDPTDTFIFTVTGGGLTLRVSVQGNGNQTIVGLPVGAYTIHEAADWSWRYGASAPGVTLSRTNPSASVTVNNTVTNDQWLGGDAHAVNRFPLSD